MMKLNDDPDKDRDNDIERDRSADIYVLTPSICLTKMLNMKTATVREVQHGFRHLLTWIAEGETIEITSRRQVVARIIPPPPPRMRKIKMPDFVARMRREYPHPRITDRQAAALIEDLRGER
jgi:antitoxin (DNA-binding transcriptional repressor) of toxin-antitoxin stability system